MVSCGWQVFLPASVGWSLGSQAVGQAARWSIRQSAFTVRQSTDIGSHTQRTAYPPHAMCELTG